MTITFEESEDDDSDFRVVYVDGKRVGVLAWWRGVESLDAWYFEDDSKAGALEKVCALGHSRAYAEGHLAHMLEQRLSDPTPSGV